MDIVSRKYGIASLIALILIAFGFNAAGAEYSLGSESDDWWTEYPDQSTGAGGDVSHPDWVLDALESKPVLIYVHKECDYCVPQTEAVQKIIDEFSGEITIFELGADGSDIRSGEALQAYDPNGGLDMFVPLTVILTLAPDSEGEVVAVWHSSDEITGEEWIRNYVEDAISLYDENYADWDN
ncbi:thioredoxin family protein [Methanothrix soehngenii]|mgnify:FL=1|jgi:hypothetical protein|nr:thioredoxin family protein [Methanothrix soehngenii]